MGVELHDGLEEKISIYEIKGHARKFFPKVAPEAD